MKILVIPDIHLKPWIFEAAAKILNNRSEIDYAVCLMDIADDKGNENELSLYTKSYQAAIDFAVKFPDTKWCYGNHDLSYVWMQYETGFNPLAIETVSDMLNKLQNSIDSDNIAYIHRIDNVIFSHGGLSKSFVDNNLTLDSSIYCIDDVIENINSLGSDEMWDDNSPIWFRPQYEKTQLYEGKNLLHVVGHTPVQRVTRIGNLISCDTFSTYPNHRPYGNRKFAIIDTITWEYEEISGWNHATIPQYNK